MFRRPSAWLLAWLVAAAGLGCQSVFLKPPHWTVTLSPLDYVQFMTGTDNGLNVGVRMLRVELLGSGYLSYWAGSSPRVADDFWTERQTDQWDEYRQDSLAVSPTYTLGCFQHLVDTGFFEDEPYRLKAKTVPATNAVFVVASLNGRKKAAMSTDPQIQIILQELLKQF